ncbi:hypothetical protein SAMN00777080_2591 [Aquiflexum balticum DSM 16537]|uniref:CAAX protease self-immunity n=1 Tax=Aquiflexum balticum DSM 16537 TaxID=758820 RepID=A0A1W2H4U6_9BACT|nr:hypothetical protein [Aquiflexum balticum]SMD43977.1 hypothetical protein SAMN00777080_2591 [Aquiflexum balticum DSM 16537]
MGPDFHITKSAKQNIIIYAAFLIIAVIGIIYGNEIKNNFTFFRVWDYKNILILLLGIPFLFLQSKANLPNFLEQSITNKQRFLNPFLIGIAFGILDVFIVKIIMHPEPYTELPPFLQPFPYSNFLYFSGAFEIEVFYRLIPLTLILLLGKWFAKGKYFNIFLWTGIVLTSFREPIEQLPDGELWFVAYALLTGFLMNFLQAIYYKNAGFLASLTLRLGHYLFWHILLGIYVQYFELQ